MLIMIVKTVVDDTGTILRWIHVWHYILYAIHAIEWCFKWICFFSVSLLPT